uniref:Uncharacterized protein n=1 Tax=Klebsiella pneumoniae TaxID=573 RepID=A0A483E128_KLEPN
MSELKPPGVGLSCSLVVHGLLLAVLFWSAVRERAQQNTWHEVDAPAFSVQLTPAATAAVAEEVVAPPPVPVVEKAEIALEQAKPVRAPPEKPPEVKPVRQPPQRSHTA